MKKFHALDFETTGLNPSTDRIVSWAVITFTKNIITQVKRGIVNPGIDIPEESTAVHGITTETVQQFGARPKNALREIIHTLQEQDYPLVVFNARFDLSMLIAELKRHGIPGVDVVKNLTVIDPLVIDRALDSWRKGGRKLRDVCGVYGVPLVGEHSAEGDAVAAGLVAWELFNRFPGEFSDLRVLHENQVVWGGQQAVNLAKYLRSLGREYDERIDWPFFEEENE